MPPGCLPVGMPAPPFVIRAHDGTALGVRPCGRPRVLAIVHDWRPTDTGRIRALLRGLGAEMTILADAGAWAFRPDDPIEQLACAPERFAANLATTSLLYGIPDERDAVFVIDEHGTIAFAYSPTTSLASSLAGALQAALDARQTRPQPPLTFSRREWATSCLVTGFAIALLACKSTREETRTQPGNGAHAQPPAPAAPADLAVVLTINGHTRRLTIDPRTSLLDALRERLGLVGTKKGCDGGQCGACTVRIGNRRVVSCLTLAVMAQGEPITTIEGLASDGKLHPMQAAFIAHDAFQCGFCTPGQIMSAVAMLDEPRQSTAARSDAELREQMSGNLCRCGAYPNIIAAIRAARGA